MAAFASLDSLCAGARPDKGRGVAALLRLEASPAAAAAAGVVKAGVVLVLVAALSSGVAVVITGELPSLLSAAVRKLRLQACCVPLLLPGACGSRHRETDSTKRAA